MQLTLIGLVVFLVGLYLVFAGRIESVFVFAVLCTLMGGSAAIILTALGSASISPAHLALGFLFARILMKGNGDALVLPALKKNMFFVTFVFYAVASAIALPRIFKNRMDVVPMRPAGLKSLYDAFPLEATSQNTTTAVYIVGTLLLAICTFVAVRQPGGVVRFVKASVILVLIHAMLGILSALPNVPVLPSILGFFRNGSYAQVEQSIGGYVRIAGIMPEASTYASFGFSWFAFVMELWLRDVMPRRTGPAAALMAVVLICSTSSTAYVSLAAYVLILAVRMLAFPGAFKFRTVLWIVGFSFAGVLFGCLMAVLNPALADNLLAILQRVTLNKANSSSGLQRVFWAKQGLSAFQNSYGLGIGVGSFRSSSFLTAVLGSVGLIGSSTMLCYLVVVFNPLRGTTYYRPADAIGSVGVAAGWAAMLTLVPLSISWPSPDPGLPFAIFCGTALALQSQVRKATRGPSPQGPDRQKLLSHFPAHVASLDA